MSKITVTVDVEYDRYTTNLTNIDCLPRFQALCADAGVKPVYLCAYEVVNTDKFEVVARLQRAGAVIGSHFHAPDAGMYPTRISLNDFRTQLETLTKLIKLKAGQSPKDYRAGRYGFCAEHIPILLDLGYERDYSVTPLVSWAEDGGPDYRRAPRQPYYLDRRDICKAGDSPLQEIPITIVRGLFKNHWLRPADYLSSNYLTSRNLAKVYRKARLPQVQLFLHSFSLLDEAVYPNVRGLFDEIKRN